MIWVGLITWLFMILMCCVLFISFEIEIDTQKLNASLEWGKMVTVRAWFDPKLHIQLRILRFKKFFSPPIIKLTLNSLTRKTPSDKSVHKNPHKKVFKKIIRAIKSFKVINWNLAIDTGDCIVNAKLFPLNFIPTTYNHLNINFCNENYLYIKIRNNLWRLIKAYLF